MNLLIFGPPGAGKGTQSHRIASLFGVMHISTGDLFRDNIKRGTPLGLEAQAYTDKGKLVPDALTVRLLEDAFDRNKQNGFILDGFPRNVDQARALLGLMAKRDSQIDKVLVLKLPTQVLVERLSGRRTCRNCGEVFHLVNRPPTTEGVCDRCGSTQLIQRPDDDPKVIQTRLETFEAQTAPVEAFFAEMGRVTVIDGNQTEEQVFRAIETELKGVETLGSPRY